MNDDNFIVSGFDDRNETASMSVDFALAKPLDRSGSTCDAYECTVQRRRVFVKRLKAEYRDNPLYRAAFDKEYDLGVSLSHPSLPRYIGFGGDYIVMDFIEGDTLADLMKRDDPRLRNRKFVRRLLIELVDVVEYLHRRNIVHCDIKADNVIVSPYDDRPVSLIDLDKAYTSWLDTTHGNTEKYGWAVCADGAIDFRGIGKIAARLGQGKVARACKKDNVSAPGLRQLLRIRKRINGVWLFLIGIAVAACGVALLSYPKEEKTALKPIGIPVDTIPLQDTAATSELRSTAPDLQTKPTIDPNWISSLIARKRQEINGYRATLWAILDCDTIPIGSKRDAIYDYNLAYGLAYTGIIYSAVTHYHNISEIDVQMAVRTHQEWIDLEKSEEDVRSRINRWSDSIR